MGQVDNVDYVQLQLLNQKLQELDSAISRSDEQMEHALVAIQTLESLENAQPDQELLIPLGSGTFLEVKASSIEQVKFIVGANIMVDKSISDTITSIKSQLQELHGFQEKSITLYHEVVDKINILQGEIESKIQG